MVRQKNTPSLVSLPRDRTRSDLSVHVNKSAKRKNRVLKEIRRMQLTVNLLIPKAPFVRLIRETILEVHPMSFWIQPQATAALQEAAEAYMVQFFEDCVLAAQHAKRVTIQRVDVYLVRRFRGRNDVANK